MPLKQKLFVFRASEELGNLFRELKKILKPYAKSFDIRNDIEHQYELWTEHEFRTNSFHPKRQRGVLFAGIAIKNSHVGFYFYPLHINPSMEESLPEKLKAIRKGKSAFHFTEITDDLKENLKQMLEEGFTYYKSNGWVLK